MNEEKIYNIVAWNINGYNDEIHKELMWKLKQVNSPDIIFLSETKRRYDYVQSKLAEFVNYNYIINCHNPANFHGVAMLIKRVHAFEYVQVSLNIPVRRDNKSNDATIGRIICIKFIPFNTGTPVYVIGT